MIHIAETCCPPYERTFCGLPISDAEPMGRANCVVCVEMERWGAQGCGRCRGGA